MFVRLLQYSDFRPLTDPETFRAYLRTVCENASKDYLQKLRRRHESELSPEEAASLRSNLPSPLDAQALDQYERVLSQLKPKERNIIKWATDGFTIQEIADAEGLTYSNAGVQLHRIRRKIREMLVRLKRLEK